MIDIDVTTLTEEELGKLYRSIVDEHTRRDNEKRAKLMENFKNAFYALQDAGVEITYTDVDDNILPLCWDNFIFD